MAILIALTEFNDLGRSVTPTFLFRNEDSEKPKDFIYNYLLFVQKRTKNQCGKLKKAHNFRPRDMESCHLEAERRVKLWSLNANLFFEEPHQFTKFA